MAKREKAVQAAQVALNSQEVRRARSVGYWPTCPLSNSRLYRRAPQKTMRMDAETRTFFETLMKADVRPEQENLKLLILDQLKTLRNKSGRCVWHTPVLGWCTDVYRSNPGAYQHTPLSQNVGHFAWGLPCPISELSPPV